MITLEVYFDVISAWSYIAKRRLEAALRLVDKQVRINVVWLPFELDPKLPREGETRSAWCARRSRCTALAIKLDAQAASAGLAEGLKLAFDRIERVPNTRDAHRLIALARDVGIQNAIVEALFRAYFIETRDLSVSAVLIDVVTAAGLNRQRICSLLQSDTGITEVWAAQARALELGVKTVPQLVLNGWQLFPRSWDPRTLAATLERVSSLAVTPISPFSAATRRERYGFTRTRCGCDFCRAYCKHVPGRLDVADLDRLCPVGQDVFAWAEEHLQAVTDCSYPKLVPARQANGHCHWYQNGQCTVHEHAPYGCAFFDAHLPPIEVEQRSTAATRASLEDAARDGLYTQVWRHLCARGLTRPSGNRSPLEEELRLIELSVVQG
jgi:predicted DsbA family dithiol-disulfide isomerase